MKCRICGADMTNYIELNDIPISVSVLYTKPAQTIVSFNGKFYTCNSCGHHQIKNLNTNNYYEDYLMQVSHSAKINQLQEKQIKKLVQFASKLDSFIEIGCGDGNFLEKASVHFKSTLGYEPSKSFYELCIKKNLNVLNEYFPSQGIENKSFDVFVSRQVFEHLENPQEVLVSIFRKMNIGGIGLIEVPNGRNIFNNGRYYEVIGDHLNYFTEKSLVKLVTDVGFEIICLEEDFGGDYLVVYVRKIKSLENLANNQLIQKKNDDCEYVKKIEQYTKIAIWGAGAKAFNYINLLSDDSKIYSYIDSDQYKIGKYLPKATKPIEEPSENILNADLVVIFAASYEDEIMSYLKKINYQQSVMLLSKNVIIDMKI